MIIMSNKYQTTMYNKYDYENYCEQMKYIYDI